MSIKFRVLEGFFFGGGGGGSADFIFMGARIFLTKPHPSKPHPCNMPQAKTEVALQFLECCAAETALQHSLFCSADVICTKNCAAANETLHCNIEIAALQESGAFLPLSCRFPAGFKPPRLGSHVSDLPTFPVRKGFALSGVLKDLSVCNWFLCEFGSQQIQFGSQRFRIVCNEALRPGKSPKLLKDPLRRVSTSLKARNLASQKRQRKVIPLPSFPSLAIRYFQDVRACVRVRVHVRVHVRVRARGNCREGMF